MSKKLSITILTDKSSWMIPYSKKLLNLLKEQGHDVILVHSKKDIKKGDIAFFLSCFEIIPQSYLDLNKHNIVVHESDLPQGKGWSPLSWQILEGKNEIPIVLFEATSELDAGDIYYRDTLIFDGTELIGDLRSKQGEKTVNLSLKFVKEYGSISSYKQMGIDSYYKKRKPEDSEINLTKSIAEQFNLLRIVDNEKYPAFFFYKGFKYILKISRS